MDAGDLLLTPEEVWNMYQEFPEEEQGQYERRLCRAQAAKVLAVLLREARSELYDEWHFINAIITETGLTRDEGRSWEDA